jgi:radical SAM superfamily enzyme YgiQ (UPF0313 family)
MCKNMKVIKIYLADLVYDTVKTNYMVPLNIAYIAALTKQIFGDNVEIKLFKYPKELEKEIIKNPPDIIGFSHYGWNSNLSLLFINMIKRLNPNVITVMGGPNIRNEKKDLKTFLKTNPNLDYYILFDGEKPFVDLVYNLLNNKTKVPDGCATLREENLIYNPITLINQEIDLPSPYLTGWLDKFLKDPNMIPLIETNRGCPFGCAYCTWGSSARSKLRKRDLNIIEQEINYISENSAGQADWIFTDANFGIFPRDIEIAKMIRKVMDKKRIPINVTLWHSKNTSERNIRIAEIIKSQEGYIAIQSSDKEVLKNCGRGGINLEDIKKQIDYYKEKNLQVLTDLLIGLPGENFESHFNSLKEAFDIGFNRIFPYNIRLLPGSKYESDAYRKEYQINTKFRPIFGCYGIYDGKIVFEIEESVRATKDMSEEELNEFKVYHWLIYFIWNMGIFKPILKFSKKNKINPMEVLKHLVNCNNDEIKKLFEHMKDESMKEWFDTKEELIKYYKIPENYNSLVEKFVKLNFLYIALIYKNSKLLKSIQEELIRILKEDYALNKNMKELVDISNKLICKDLLQKESKEIIECSREIASIITDKPDLLKKKRVKIEIYRPKRYVDLCNFYLNPNGRKDFSVQNLTRFLELDGMVTLSNKLRIVEE